jgi:predicted aspartyl protease
MGHVFTAVKFSGTKASIEVKDVLVDSGATWTVIPRSLATSLGATVVDKVKVQIVGGQQVDADVAVVRATVAGRTAPVFAAVIDGQEQVLLGVQTLETLGLKIDPSSKPPKLEPSRSFIIGAFGGT